MYDPGMMRLWVAVLAANSWCSVWSGETRPANAQLTDE